jgi:hypothetical protein
VNNLLLYSSQVVIKETSNMWKVYNRTHDRHQVIVGTRVAQWVRSLDLTPHTSLSPIRRGFAPGFVTFCVVTLVLVHLQISLSWLIVVYWLNFEKAFLKNGLRNRNLAWHISSSTWMSVTALVVNRYSKWSLGSSGGKGLHLW